ncbi:MAG: hypothetical protein P4M08_12615 [Oligoflexia bacterium]|nr:hypothetical protein [Oligoflexia bacterium]
MRVSNRNPYRPILKRVGNAAVLLITLALSFGSGRPAFTAPGANLAPTFAESQMPDTISYDSSGSPYVIIQKDQTLGEILQELDYTPLWGPHGFVRATWLLNRNLIEKEGDLIYPGTKLRLPLREIVQTQTTPKPANRAIASEPFPAPIPSAAPASPADSIGDVMHSLSFSLGYGLTTLSAVDPVTGNSAQLLSNHDVELSATWEQGWNPNFSTFFRFSIDSIGFEQSTNPDKSLANSSNTPTELGFGATIHAGPLTFAPSLSYGDQLFVRGLTTNTVTIDSFAVPMAQLAVSAELYCQKSTSLGVEASGAFLGPVTTDAYSAHAGSSYSGGLYMEKDFGTEKSHGVRLDAGYVERNQNTSIVNLSEKSIFAGISFHFPLFGGEK